MAHNNYYLDLCAEVYVVHNNTVLLRLHEKYNFWGGPGGHIDSGEDVNETAVREAREETGLIITLVGPRDWEQHDTPSNADLVPPLFVNRHRINEQHEHSAFIFAATTEQTEVKAENAAEETECRWCTKADLDELLANDERMRPEVYRYALEALEACTR
jgi:8-oxo-dGTP pyrophosphatase MutT (NUDIX family)